MANVNVNPYGVGGELAAGYPIVNDLTTGGADKALSAQMGKELNTHYFDFDISEYETHQSLINTDNTWLKNNPSYTCKLIPVNAGETYKITAGVNGSRMAVLTADDSSTLPEFATGYSTYVPINANEELEFTIPDDGVYLYIAITSPADRSPKNVFMVKTLDESIEALKNISHKSEVPSMLKVGDPTNIIYTIDDFLLAHDYVEGSTDILKASLDLGKTWHVISNNLTSEYGNVTNAFFFADGTLMFCTRKSDGCHAYWIRDFVNITVNETTIIDYDGNELALNANETRLYNVGRVTHHEYVNGVEHFCFGDYTITTDNPRLWYSCDNGRTIRCAFAFGYSQVNGQTIYARHIHWFCYNQHDGYFYALTGDHMRNGVSECHIMRGRHDANHLWTWEVLKTGQAYKLVAPAFDAGNMYCVTDYTDSEFANKKGIVSLPINSLDVADMKYLFRATAEFMAEGSYDSRAAAIASYFTDNHGWRIAGSDYLGNSKLLIAKGGHNFKWVDNDAGLKFGNWMGPNNNGDCYATYTIPNPNSASGEAWLRISHRQSYNVTDMFRNSGMTDFFEGWSGEVY